MGQYYKALVKNDKAVKTFNPQESIYMTRNELSAMPDGRVAWGTYDDPDSFLSCFSGMKLLEHSYIGNHYVNGVMEEIENNPSRVAWVGDYADEDTDFTETYTADDYKTAWEDEDMKDSPFKRLPEVHTDGYIVNYSKGLYIDIAHYIKKSDVYNDDEGWIVHPLPLLTAIGNGRGGGDYRSYNRDTVGVWATDIIEYTHEKPYGYTEFIPLFDPNA